MHSVPLGSSGLEVSPVAFGCGDNAGLMVAGDQAQQRRAVAYAIERGITLFDTAAKYGNGQSEKALGSCLQQHRDADVAVGTKISLRPEPGDDLRTYVRQQLQRSLERLQRDDIALYQVHNRIAAPDYGSTMDGGLPTISVPEVADPGGLAEILTELKTEGLVRAIGLIGYGGDPAALAEVAGLGAFDVINVSYHMLNPSAFAAVPPGWPATDYRQLGRSCAEHGLGVLAIRPLAGGWLTTLPADGVTPPPSARVPDRDVFWSTEIVEALQDRIAAADGSLPRLAQSFSLATPGVSSVVCGFSELAHIDMAVDAATRPTLGASDVVQWTNDVAAIAHATTPGGSL